MTNVVIVGGDKCKYTVQVVCIYTDVHRISTRYMLILMYGVIIVKTYKNGGILLQNGVLSVEKYITMYLSNLYGTV